MILRLNIIHYGAQWLWVYAIEMKLTIDYRRKFFVICRC